MAQQVLEPLGDALEVVAGGSEDGVDAVAVAALQEVWLHSALLLEMADDRLDGGAGDRPHDIRARAILMLLITYGLRAGEASGLMIEDIHWEQEMLRVRCPKPGRTHHYPLSRSVAQSILRYLREVRSDSPERRLFLMT